MLKYALVYYSKQLRKKHAASAGDDVSDSDTATIGASDADAESDTETEDYEQGKAMLVVVTPLVGVFHVHCVVDV